MGILSKLPVKIRTNDVTKEPDVIAGSLTDSIDEVFKEKEEKPKKKRKPRKKKKDVEADQD